MHTLSHTTTDVYKIVAINMYNLVQVKTIHQNSNTVQTKPGNFWFGSKRFCMKVFIQRHQLQIKSQQTV